MKHCTVCPRNCAVDRTHTPGYCKALWEPVVYCTEVHTGEESVISGSRGSGAVFFAGCNLGCVFCQNDDISQKCYDPAVPPPQLAETFIKLEADGVHNINLVTPGHFAPQIAEAIRLAKNNGINIPFVYNTNGYDALASLEMLDGLIDIYMPDLKFADDAHGQRYCDVPNYFSMAQQALREMYRQVGDPMIRKGIMQKGLLIRHLMMPGLTEDTMAVLDWIKANTPTALVNLTKQYRPLYRAGEYEEINRRVTAAEYRTAAAYFRKLGLAAPTGGYFYDFMQRCRRIVHSRRR